MYHSVIRSQHATSTNLLLCTAKMEGDGGYLVTYKVRTNAYRNADITGVGAADPEGQCTDRGNITIVTNCELLVLRE